MELLPGIDAWARLVKAEVTAANPGVVPFQAITEIVALSEVNAILGDLLIVVWLAKITIGANSGVRAIQLDKKAGTATILYANNYPFARYEALYNAGAGDPVWSSTAFFSVTGSGTLTMRMRAEANVAGSQINGGDGQLRMYLVRGR